MPNWSFIPYYIRGKKQDIIKIDTCLHELWERDRLQIAPSIKNDFGPRYLGCLLKACGIKNYEDIYARGEFVEFYRESDTRIFLLTKVAWGEQSEFRKALCEFFPGLEMIYYDEGNYVTNDKDSKYFPTRYELRGDLIETQYCANLRDLAICIRELLGDNVDPDLEAIEKLLDKYNSEHGKCSCYLHTIEVVVD